MKRFLARLVRVAMALLVVTAVSVASDTPAFAASTHHKAHARKHPHGSHDPGKRPKDAKAPSLSFRAPTAERPASGLLACVAHAADRSGIAEVVFRLDGRRIASDRSAPFRCGHTSSGRLDTSKLRNGWHTLSATAYDRAGNARRRTIRIHVSNPRAAKPASKPRSPAPVAPPTVTPVVPPIEPAPLPIPSPGDPGGLFFDGSHLSDYSLIQDAGPDRIQEVVDPLGSGSKVFKVSVKNSDVYPLTPTANPRAQALSPSFIKPGMEFWLRHSVMFPTDFPSSVPGWLEFMAIYGPPFNGSSPVAMGVRGSDIVFARGKAYGYDTPWKMPLVKNRWVDIMIHERFGTDGWVEIYVDGHPVTMSGGQTRLYMKTVDAANGGGPNHVKFSMYFQANMFPSLTMYHSGLRSGSTRASVGG